MQSACGEQCDDGNASSDDACTNACTLNVCGDGFVRTGVEQCDDGNVTSGDGCSASCQSEGCGDGIVQVALGEQCDGGDDSPLSGPLSATGRARRMCVLRGRRA